MEKPGVGGVGVGEEGEGERPGGGGEGRMLGNDPGVSNIYIQRRGIPTRFTNRTRDSFGRP